jgi:hypothetical protein
MRLGLNPTRIETEAPESNFNPRRGLNTPRRREVDSPDSDAAPRQDVTVGPWGEVEFSSAVALVLAEEVVASESQTVPGRRVAPADIEAALASRPIVVVLDQLETLMSFNESHGWVMMPHDALGGLRPVEAIAHGHVRDVLSVIDASFPRPA